MRRDSELFRQRLLGRKPDDSETKNQPRLGDVIYGTCNDGKDRIGEVTSMVMGFHDRPDSAQISETRKVDFNGKVYYVKGDEGKERHYSIAFDNIKKKLVEAYSGSAIVTTEYGLQNSMLSAKSPDGIIRRDFVIGTPPPAHNESQVNQLYQKMVKFFKEWEAYGKLGTADLRELYQRTFKIDMGSMRDVNKQSLIAGIMESKHGRSGFPSDMAKRLESMTGKKADDWQKKAVAESRGRSITIAKPTSSPIEAKLPAPGFKEENRLGWDRNAFQQFFAATKPGSVWPRLKKLVNSGEILKISDRGLSEIRQLRKLFEGSAPYPGLARLLLELEGAMGERASENIYNAKAIIAKMEPRIVRLWEFGRAQALAKSIVIKSMNKRLI